MKSGFNSKTHGMAKVAGAFAGMIMGKTANSFENTAECFRSLAQGKISDFLLKSVNAIDVKMQKLARLETIPHQRDAIDLAVEPGGKGIKAAATAFKKAQAIATTGAKAAGQTYMSERAKKATNILPGMKPAGA